MLPEPPDGYYKREYVEPRIKTFVHGIEYEATVPLPKRADPVVVDEFLQKALEKDDLTDQELYRIGNLMRFYALQERAPRVATLLNKQERKDKQFNRALAAVALLGDFGDEPLQKQAAEYYSYLATHFLAPKFYAPLVDLFFHLPEGADEQVIAQPIQNKMKTLEPKVDSDDDAAVEYYRLEKLPRKRLPSVLEARKRRLEILKATDVKKRRRDLGRCYLRFDRNPYVDLRMWAAMVLQLDCEESEPAQLAEAFADGFELLKSSASRKGVLSAGDQGDLKKYVTSCARAVEFYHGRLKPEQEEYAKEHENDDQDDILYWDPMQSKEATGQPVTPKPKPAATQPEKETDAESEDEKTA